MNRQSEQAPVTAIPDVGVLREIINADKNTCDEMARVFENCTQACRTMALLKSVPSGIALN